MNNLGTEAGENQGIGAARFSRQAKDDLTFGSVQAVRG